MRFLRSRRHSGDGVITHKIAGLLGILALCVCCYWPLRLAYADHLACVGSLPATARASELVPGNAEYLLRQAKLLDEAGQDPVPCLERAAALEAPNASIWIQLGLQAEIAGDWPKAENYLLKAARASKQYEPRWALANYYFRRGDAERFWPWAKQALEISHEDPRPLFTLCWQLSEDAPLILQRAIPERKLVLRQYLSFLLEQNRLAATPAVLQQLLARPDPSDAPVAMNLCSRLLQAGSVASAVELWNHLCRQKLIAYEPLEPQRGVSITNPAFRPATLPAAFDWRMPDVPGVSVEHVTSPPYLAISFWGKQPENCEVLWQYLPLAAGRTYRFGYRYRTEAIPRDAGLRWAVLDVAKGTELTTNVPHLSSSTWAEESLLFSTPPGLESARLALCYRRALGTTRIEGVLCLENVNLRFAHE